MKDVISEAYTPRNVKTLGDFKTLVKPFLMELGTITKETVINNSRPKLIVVWNHFIIILLIIFIL